MAQFDKKDLETFDIEESRHFLKLFHCLIQHNNQEEEVRRSEVAFEWLLDNAVKLRQVCLGSQLELIGLVNEFGMEHKYLPSLTMLENILRSPANTVIEQALEQILQEYKLRRDAGEFSLYNVVELSAILSDIAHEFEDAFLAVKLTQALGIVRRPTADPFDKKSKKPRELYKAKDALGFLMRVMENGVLVEDTRVDHPICVQNEAHEILEDYDEELKSFPTGFNQFQLYPGDFMGILGYQGDGKSTLSRFIAYQCAAAGFSVGHICLEEEARRERNRYILLHAHNPKFNGEYKGITMEKFKTKTLTKSERAGLEFVSKDFKEHMSGKLVIRQPASASWNHVQTTIEMQDLAHPLDIVLLDYVQLLEPPTNSREEGRGKLARVIKSIRQFGLSFQPSRKLAIISPVQGNEAGKAAATEAEGVWKRSGINDDKELGRSMNFMTGVFDYGPGKDSGHLSTNNNRISRMSSVKDRDAIGFAPFLYQVTGTGWLIPGCGEFEEKYISDQIEDLGADGTPNYVNRWKEEPTVEVINVRT